jgi:hypothetical protein
MVVDVLFEKDKVRFEIPKSYKNYGGGLFDGKIDSKGIRGTFRFNGTAGDQENLLRRPSYWDQ